MATALLAPRTAACGHCGENLPVATIKAHYAAKYAAPAPVEAPAPMDEEVTDVELLLELTAPVEAPAPEEPVAAPLVDPGFAPVAAAPAMPEGVDWKAIRALPAGRYATVEGEKVDFWRVETTEQGYRFITRLIGAPGDFRKVKVAKAVQVAVLTEIAADPAPAMKAFADHFTACGRCCSPLTDETSRDRGLGPDCWSMMKGDGVAWV